MRIKCTLIVSAWLIVMAPAAAMPKIQIWRLDTGAKVLFSAASDIPMVDVKIIFDAGSARNGERGGLALLTNSLLEEGAGGMSADQISEGFDDLGAEFGASAGYDYASLSLRCLSDPKVLQPALDNFVRVLTRPDFPDDAIIRQKKRMLVGIRNKQQSPHTLASEALFAGVFGDHPYAAPRSGSEASVNALTRDDIVEFYRRHYVAGNATLAIVGDLEDADTKHLVTTLLDTLPVGTPPSPIPMADGSPSTSVKHIRHPSSQTHLVLGQIGIRFGDPDYFPLYVGNHILGGGGMVSRLFYEIREQRGLSYSVGSYFSPLSANGVFQMRLQTRNDRAKEARQLLQHHLETFIERGPTSAELEASQKNITGGFPLKLNSNRKIANYLGMIGFYDLPDDYLETYNDRVDAVTVGAIKDAFARRIMPDQLMTVVVGPDAL